MLRVVVKNWVMVQTTMVLCLGLGVGAQERLQEEGPLAWVLKENYESS